MTAATLSYKDQFAWGLRVNPSFDQLAQSVTKKFKFQRPDRRAKWWALSNERAFMLDAANKVHDYEHLLLDYNQSGARAPRAAALVQPAAEAEDPAWEQVRETTRQAEDHDYIAEGFERMNARLRHEAAAAAANYLRDQAARALMPQQWFIGDHHEELEDAGVEHEGYHHLVRYEQPRGLAAPVPLPIAHGHVGAQQPFPTFEELNMRQPRRFNNVIARIDPQDVGYAALRDRALGSRDNPYW
jgi:hypothetical protein